MQNPGGGKQAASKQNSASDRNDYEMLAPLTKSVLLIFQVLQTLALLHGQWVVAKGTENWLGNLMPVPGTMVTLILAFFVFTFLWVQRIKVLPNVK